MVETFQIIIDFGLFVLIWMVQLLIYPSFKYYDRENLIKWHRIYTKNISLVVIPLMLIQLGIHSFLTYSLLLWPNFFSLTLIIITWILTFSIFVPIHRKIALGNYSNFQLKKLVSFNWMRTFLWTIVFINSILNIIQ